MLSILFSLVLEGATLEWGFPKDREGFNSAENQVPKVTVYDIEIYVDTRAVGEATSVSISIGNINGSLALELDGTVCFYNQDFQTEASMDACLQRTRTTILY